MIGNKMSQNNSYNSYNMMDTDDQVRVVQPRNAKEKILLDTLKKHGFHIAAASLDCWKERVNVDAAIASWAKYPEHLVDYPKIITKKVKIDPKDLL
jgi:hypothetical protein